MPADVLLLVMLGVLILPFFIIPALLFAALFSGNENP